MTAKIGDFGASGTYTNSDSTSDIVSWKVTDAGSGKAYLSVLTTSKDSSGATDGTSESRYLINTAGDRLSIRLKVYFPASGYSLTLSGNNI